MYPAPALLHERIRPAQHSKRYATRTLCCPPGDDDNNSLLSSLVMNI
jgi:hypothetical protein